MKLIFKERDDDAVFHFTDVTTDDSEEISQWCLGNTNDAIIVSPVVFALGQFLPTGRSLYCRGGHDLIVITPPDDSTVMRLKWSHLTRAEFR